MADNSASGIFHNKYTDSNKDQILLQSVLHTAQMASNTFWPKLIKGLNYWFKIPKDKLEEIENIVYILNAANNVFNDISANAEKRNGVATANSLYGTSDAVNSAFYSSFLALEKIRALGGIQAIKLATEHFLNNLRAQGMEFYWQDNLKCPSEENYMKMAVRKTGDIIRFTAQLMQLFSTNKTDMTDLMEKLGMLFHIYDDYMNLKSTNEYLLNKNGCDSISEGKFTFPVIHAIHARPEDVHLLNILRQKSKHEEVVKYCLSLLEQSGSFEYSKQVIEKLGNEAEEEMAKFQENPYIIQIIDNIYSKLNVS